MIMGLAAVASRCSNILCRPWREAKPSIVVLSAPTLELTRSETVQPSLTNLHEQEYEAQLRALIERIERVLSTVLPRRKFPGISLRMTESEASRYYHEISEKRRLIQAIWEEVDRFEGEPLWKGVATQSPCDLQREKNRMSRVDKCLLLIQKHMYMICKIFKSRVLSAEEVSISPKLIQLANSFLSPSSSLHYEGQIASGTFGKILSLATPRGPYAIKEFKWVPEKPRRIIERAAIVEMGIHLSVNELPGVVELVFLSSNPLHIGMEMCKYDLWLEIYRQELTPRQFLADLEQLLNTLKQVHERGIVHMDVSAKNCLVHEERGQRIIKLCDFGLSTREGEDVFGGTAMYLAPETINYNDRAKEPYIAKGIRASAKIDMWALGVMIFVVITGGQFPFKKKHIFNRAFFLNQSLVTAQWKKIFTTLKGFDSRLGDLAPIYQSFLERTLVVDPALRSSSSELLLFLERAQSNKKN